MRTHPTLLLVLGLALGACQDSAGPPTVGTLVVSTSTGGTEPDQDGYLLTVDGVDSLALVPTGTVEVDLPPGRHTLRLLGVAEHCSVAPATSFQVDVPSQGTIPVAFEISCQVTGTLVVSTSTGGNDPDPDGYLLTVDGVDSLVLVPTGTSRIDLPAGQHALRLLGVAEHCSVSPGIPLDVAVPSRDTTSVAFEVTCSATGVRITTTTTGLDIDPDGYRIAVGGTDRGAIPANDTVLIRVEPGSRTIALTGLAPNCAVDGPGSSPVTIVEREVALVAFVIVCTATTGVLAYTGIDGDIHLINPDGTNHRNLTTDGPANRDMYPVWSPDGDRIAFTRPDDFGPSVHVEEIHVINADGTNLVRLSPPGGLDYELTWSPDGQRIAFVHTDRSDLIAPQQIYVMTADGANRVRLSPPGALDNDPTWSPDGQRIAFVHVFDPTTYRPTQISVMNADGTNRVPLTTRSSGAWFPAWSPDGGKIAFLAGGTNGGSGNNYNIYVMNADGTHQSALTNDPVGEQVLTWSPDGTRIVYSRKRSLFVMNADGTNQRRLTSPPETRWSYRDYEPAWSPDGHLIVFTRSYDCDPFNDNGGPPCMPSELRTIQLTGVPFASSLVTQGVDVGGRWRP